MSLHNHNSVRGITGMLNLLCWWVETLHNMMTSSNGNIFRVTGHLCGEFTGPRWIPRTKASNAELWCFFFICVWINGWVNNRKPGDLRRYRVHYDVIIMIITKNIACNTANTGKDRIKFILRYDVMTWQHFPCYWPFVFGRDTKHR